MKHKNIFKIFILIIFLLVVYFVFSELKPREEINRITEFEPDGINMKYTAFNKNNKKGLEISCIESKSEGRNKILMKKINATIFQKGKLDQDIFISGESGYVANNFNNFYVEKNAHIFSKDMDIKSENFLLKGRALLTTEELVDYSSKGLQGKAENGMQYFVRTNVLKLFNTQGIYSRGNSNFDYSTTVLWFSDPLNSLFFETKTVIRDPESIFKSDQLRMKFSKDLKVIRQTTSYKSSYFYWENRQKKEIKEINSRYLGNYYDQSGKLIKTIIRRNAQVMLKDAKNHCDISAHTITLKYDKETGNILTTKIQRKAKVNNSGKSNFSISAATIFLNFQEGEIKHGKANDNCKFKIENYTGVCDKMNFDIEKNTIHLKGIESTVKKEKNTFISSDFIINTKSNILTSSEGIKSILTLDSKNVLFSKESIFIHAKNIEINNKENKIQYKDNIRLHQNDTILKADQLEIIQKNNLKATGKVFLSFKNNRDDIILQGDSFYFDSKDKRITISKNGFIKNKNRILKADSIEITFDQNNELSNITGEKNIIFNKDDITGKSEKVNWQFKEEMMTFLNSAEIKNKSGSTTKGNELRFDLKNNKIIIISDQSTRTETIIE